MTVPVNSKVPVQKGFLISLPVSAGRRQRGQASCRVASSNVASFLFCRNFTHLTHCGERRPSRTLSPGARAERPARQERIAMADITPLRGEGRTVGRITGPVGRAAFRVLRGVRPDLVRRRRGRRGRGRPAGVRPDRGPHDDLPGGRRLAADHLGLGDGRRLRRLGGRRRERRPPQPGGDPGVRRAAQVRLGEGPALLGRPGARRVRRRRAGVPRLRQRDQRVQPRREDAQERRPGARDVLDLRHVPRRVLPRRHTPGR